MKRLAVKARMVRSMGWEQGVLEVEYQTGLVHQYLDVTEEEWIRASTGNVDKKMRLIGKTHPFIRVE